MGEKKEFNKKYNKLIKELQIKLVHMQDWVIENDKKYHDQLNEMQAEIYRIAEKIGELDEDINLENIYGLGRLKATDPELRSLAIMQSKDDDIRNEFNTLLEKLIVLKKEIQDEINKDTGPTVHPTLKPGNLYALDKPAFTIVFS